MESPKVFISYSWDNSEHKAWVIALANELRKKGIDAEVDEFFTQTSTVNLNRMMIDSITKRDYTIVILTDKYAEKAEANIGGVGFETNILINEIRENLDSIILLMRFVGNSKLAIPSYLKGVSYIDFSNDENFSIKFKELLHRILKVDFFEKEPLGVIPNLTPKKLTIENLQKNKDVVDNLIPDLKQITDMDINRFMKVSFFEIIKCLTELSEQTKEKNNNFDFEVEEITSKKTKIIFYLNGMIKHSVKIWLGNNISKEESIHLSYGDRFVDSDNSYNEFISCKIEDGKNLKLKMMMNMQGISDGDAREIATEIWKDILRNLK